MALGQKSKLLKCTIAKAPHQADREANEKCTAARGAIAAAAATAVATPVITSTVEEELQRLKAIGAKAAICHVEMHQCRVSRVQRLDVGAHDKGYVAHAQRQQRHPRRGGERGKVLALHDVSWQDGRAKLLCAAKQRMQLLRRTKAPRGGLLRPIQDGTGHVATRSDLDPVHEVKGPQKHGAWKQGGLHYARHGHAAKTVLDRE